MIGTKLEAVLKSRDMRIAELSRLTNIHPQTLYSIVNKDSNRIDIDHLIRISRALCVQPDAFASDEVANQRDQKLDLLLAVWARLSPDGKDMLIHRSDELIRLGYVRAKNAESA